jgi:tRNA(Ile)-lysidine synthase
LYEITKQYGFTSGQTNEIVKLLHSDSGKFILSSSHRILKNRNWLIISPIAEAAQQIRVIEPGTDVICFENGCLSLRRKKLSPAFTKASADASLAMLDIKYIHFPLLLRKWQPGDYFYPLGMPGKKKLSRFFIDQKLSLADKERVWVLEMDKKIIWVINHRIDDRFKVTENTKEILEIQFRPG